jgi:hypothetical protein
MARIMGFLLILFGFWTALFIHAFGSMINPSVSDLEWWMQYLRNTWQGFLFSLGPIFVGGFLLFRGWKRWTPIEEPAHFIEIDRFKSNKPQGFEWE